MKNVFAHVNDATTAAIPQKEKHHYVLNNISNMQDRTKTAEMLHVPLIIPSTYETSRH